VKGGIEEAGNGKQAKSIILHCWEKDKLPGVGFQDIRRQKGTREWGVRKRYFPKKKGVGEKEEKDFLTKGKGKKNLYIQKKGG